MLCFEKALLFLLALGPTLGGRIISFALYCIALYCIVCANKNGLKIMQKMGHFMGRNRLGCSSFML